MSTTAIETAQRGITINADALNLHRFSSVLQVPDFVKKAASEEDLSRLPVDVFADGSEKKYPCHTKAATYLSALRLFGEISENQRGLFTEKQAAVRDHLMSYVQYWDLDGEIENMIDGLSKEADLAPEDLEKDFAFDFEHPEEGRVALYPMPNAGAVKRAADGAIAHRENFPFAIRKTAAEKILAKMKEFNVSLEPEVLDELNKMAGNWVVDETKLRNGLSRRVSLAAYQRPKLANSWMASAEKLESIIDEIDAGKFDKSGVTKVAQAIEEFDLSAELYHHYPQGLPMPEDVLFSKPKEASQTLQLQTGNMFKLADILDAGSSPLGILGEDFVDAVSSYGNLDIEKIAAIVPTLPLNEALQLEKAWRLAGLKAG